jgi:hypothetical protein
MKKFYFLVSVSLLTFSLHAQIKPAEKGTVYGVVSESGSPVSIDDVKSRLVKDQFEGKVTGKVVDICKAEGCWIRLERKDGPPMMVRAKDHAFTMPENIVGKLVVIDGDATVKEISEDARKHYAEDAGKSKDEIARIKGPEKDVQFAARGVKVLN